MCVSRVWTCLFVWSQTNFFSFVSVVSVHWNVKIKKFSKKLAQNYHLLETKYTLKNVCFKTNATILMWYESLARTRWESEQVVKNQIIIMPSQLLFYCIHHNELHNDFTLLCGTLKLQFWSLWWSIGSGSIKTGVLY